MSPLGAKLLLLSKANYNFARLYSWMCYCSLACWQGPSWDLGQYAVIYLYSSYFYAAAFPIESPLRAQHIATTVVENVLYCLNLLVCLIFVGARLLRRDPRLHLLAEICGSPAGHKA